jgi:hypothetical protein
MSNHQTTTAANDPGDLEAYEVALNSADWLYDDLTNEAEWAAAGNKFVSLRSMQQRIDPTGEIWMDHLRKVGLANVLFIPKPRVNATALVLVAA